MSDETETVLSCYDCGKPVEVDFERGYSIDDEHILCYDCGLRRGGRYAEDEDRWLAKPQVDDIPDAQSSHT